MKLLVLRMKKKFSVATPLLKTKGHASSTICILLGGGTLKTHSARTKTKRNSDIFIIAIPLSGPLF
jgi:hypothetical protein